MNKTLLIIGFVWPEPKSSAAGSRMLQLIAFFQSEGYQITFASACAKSDNAFDLSSISVETVPIKLNHSSFDEFVSNLNPELVLFDRFMTEEQFGWRVSEQCPNAIKVLDTEDLHFLRRARQQVFKANAKVSDVDVFSDTAKREIAAIYRCDLSLIISKAEMNLLKNQFNINDSLLFYLPFLVAQPSEAERGSYPEFEARQHFISIGNFLHEPNYNALLYLKETLWKGIKQQLPQAQLHNYGAYASQKVTQLHNEKDGFLIKGFADDVSTVMQKAKVLLAPIRFGAGLKGKLFDAMQNGTPFVSTTIGLEGIVDTNTQDYCCDQPEDFINHAVKLYQDKSLWKSQQWLGFEILNTKFSKSEFEVALRQRLKALMQHLGQHRQQNFIGQMLQHHTLQSTKYMGKWIEAKNA
ncbi:glycosyltransferase [Psychroserpens sp. SPM9]|uniref:glycosyltransferase n=1 Tax=Psychroserpens sp. SPM9 TaxID=2975598 RepID=UPI0021A3377C|nr:glycosyltransferase [Psychroserpens sp. SPM9]MDG5492092.1 glycosyltransferase [Psychroserpens sp. SPM9]